MKTPICDFVNEYAERDAVRLHMPGHKGDEGIHKYDITEIEGADVLYNSTGIIKISQENAGRLFGTEKTIYSTEGSSLSIRAMVLLVKLFALSRGEKPKILAGRNAHKTFVNAIAVLGVDVDWLFSMEKGLVSCRIDLADLEEKLKMDKPAAVYITSPDYLGNISDIQAIGELCHRYGTLLLVDNAHGGYLKFLESSLHPIDLGADMCCDSAHKTLNALTGSGYLHISKAAPEFVKNEAERAMSMFASTSPSYLILQSLDRLNLILADGYKERLAEAVKLAEKCRKALTDKGYRLIGNEPLKLTIDAKAYGYTGCEIDEYLRGRNIFCEFSDPDFIVMMISADTKCEEIENLKKALLDLPERDMIELEPPKMGKRETVVSPKEAVFMQREQVGVDSAMGRILASAEVSCPPAIPILVCGERIDEAAVECFKYYGIDLCTVLIDGCCNE